MQKAAATRADKVEKVMRLFTRRNDVEVVKEQHGKMSNIWHNHNGLWWAVFFFFFKAHP